MMPPVRPPVKRRFVELDGIRGWASLTVVVFHLFYETFGARYVLLRNPVAMAFNGQIAVAVFFVLSGEALSAGYFSGQGVRGVYALALKRYARLTIPILASVIIMVVLKRGGAILRANRRADRQASGLAWPFPGGA